MESSLLVDQSKHIIMLGINCECFQCMHKFSISTCTPSMFQGPGYGRNINQLNKIWLPIMFLIGPYKTFFPPLLMGYCVSIWKNPGLIKIRIPTAATTVAASQPSVVSLLNQLPKHIAWTIFFRENKLFPFSLEQL